MHWTREIKWARGNALLVAAIVAFTGGVSVYSQQPAIDAGSAHATGTAVETQRITQFGTLDGLMKGNYAGGPPLESILDPGVIGLGTFESLDGEMIVNNGIAYRVDVTGRVSIPDGKTRIPFAVIAQFSPTIIHEITTPVDYAAFETWLKDILPDRDVPYAIRITGSYARVHCRSVPAQKPPYKPLAEVLQSERAEFHHEAVEGSMVGFWFPTTAAGMNAPGLHLHFITADLEQGGHVLGFVGESLTIEIAMYHHWSAIFPDEVGR